MYVQFLRSYFPSLLAGSLCASTPCPRLTELFSRDAVQLNNKYTRPLDNLPVKGVSRSVVNRINLNALPFRFPMMPASCHQRQLDA
ncbi:hypothetical protein F5Y13DRAFT_63530 [Hypoxylon sp. FL1857]|nr:hypothetical protein F5Y13DRAFT_63530 [Hypoxylon sp. FL1857]